MKWNYRTESFEDFSKKMIHSIINNKIVIWGVGKRLYDLDQNLLKNLNVVKIVDSDIKKQGEIINLKDIDYYIESPQTIEKYQNEVVILIFSQAFQEIGKKLTEYGVPDKKYFVFTDFVCIWNWHTNHKIVLDEIDLPISSLCNLKCTHCIAYINRTNHSHNIPLENIKSSLKVFFKHINFVKRIVIAGGETFLYKDLTELLLFINSKFDGKFGMINLISNGMIMPSSEIFNCCKDINFNVSISDYGKYQDEKMISNIKEKFNDIGKECQIESKFGLHQDESVWLDRGDYLDLYDIKNQEEILKYYMGAVEKGYLSMCDRCNGFGKVINQNFVPVGVQDGE